MEIFCGKLPNLGLVYKMLMSITDTDRKLFLMYINLVTAKSLRHISSRINGKYVENARNYPTSFFVKGDYMQLNKWKNIYLHLGA